MYDLVVVGAGPYGLSIAAHAAAAGLRLRVLGRPMATWRDHMPDGMFLKSEPWSSHLSAPDGGHTLADYCAAHDLTAEHGVPLPLDTFTAYGRWFGERAVPQVEEVGVTAVRPDGDGFHVDTDTGERIAARTVALAVGVMPFVNRPWPLLELPPHLASHSSDHRDLSHFSGRNVTVIGSGQAALETATLLAEQGARPRIVARADRLHWNPRHSRRRAAGCARCTTRTPGSAPAGRTGCGRRLPGRCAGCPRRPGYASPRPRWARPAPGGCGSASSRRGRSC